jgi:acyl-coenzyme A synthetase/AMP-(fatty) acid ligase
MSLMSVIVMPLIAGAALRIPSDEKRMNSLAEFERRESVSWAILTPAFAKTLRPEDFMSLETLMAAGEASGSDLLQLWLGGKKTVRLWNAWGPAETCFSHAARASG